MVKSINQRVKDVIKVKKMNVNSFSKLLGMPQTSVNNYVSGARKISFELIEKIANTFPDLNQQWLLTGEGEMLKGGEEEKKTQSLPLIPVDAMAGALSGNDVSFMQYDCEYYNVPVFKGADFLIRVQGDSMVPRFFSGDIVACQRVPLSNLWFQWGKVYVLDTRQGALLKRLEPSNKEGYISIHSENPRYKPFDLPIEEINGVALIKGTIRVE